MPRETTEVAKEAGMTRVAPRPTDAAVSADPVLWFVAHTRSRQEKVLAADLRERLIEVFLPMVKTVRYYGKRKCKVELPLFPGYLFLRGTVEQGYIADRTGRVANLIRVPDQRMLTTELDQIRDVIARGGALTPASAITQGTLVEVKAGPFKGIQGVVERGIPNDRLLLQVELIGRAAVLEVDRALLTPLVQVPSRTDLESGSR